MKALLSKYAAYNVWASQKLFDCIKNLSDEKINRKITSSFPSLFATVLHMLDAENIWWQRFKLLEQINIPSQSFKGNFDELCKLLLQQSMQWEEWVNGATEVQLDHVFSYQNTKKELFKQPVYEMLQHIFNHGTYHRGQLVTLLRQLNAERIPPTDFIVFCRKK